MQESSQTSRNYDDFQVLEHDIAFTSQKSSWFMQFYILLIRMWRQMWRDKVSVFLLT